MNNDNKVETAMAGPNCWISYATVCTVICVFLYCIVICHDYCPVLYGILKGILYIVLNSCTGAPELTKSSGRNMRLGDISSRAPRICTMGCFKHDYVFHSGDNACD